ncbi:MAG: hypothetical protein US58_C0014G0008 [Candidatus Magasanikbacteria bacterium GW2011_GWA2_37_8]|uniref:Uncharacterized protein n=1 Tax=Candidatus Magasanikbacteria bacterium GW2011_GWA2_37_8 TaxID=1619036 RepID=A0A0G0KJ98_9BACT|nr:MAG: hypothetical protein US58_C0014G0008 [Candidatus Magasanikbacteria bacterium GW2011_GWA2_37_8]
MEENSQTIKDMLEILNFLKDNSVNKEDFHKLEGRFDGLEVRSDGLEGRFDGLEGRFDGLEGRFDGLEGRFDGLERKFDKHVEEQKEEFRKVREEIINHVDGFVGLHQHLESELAAVASKTDRLERNGVLVANHLQLQIE